MLRPVMIPLAILGFVLATAAPVDAQSRPSWTRRQLSPIEDDVFKWLPAEQQEELLSNTIEEVKEFIGKAQADSPFKAPWKKTDLKQFDDSKDMIQIYDEMKEADRDRLVAMPLAHAIRELRLHTGENKGTAESTLRLKLEEPDIKNAGTNRARITVKGTTENVKDGLGIRVLVELHYPDANSEPVLAIAYDTVSRNRFSADLQLPNKTLLLGKYWVRAQLEFGKVKKKSEVMVNGELPSVFYTRIAWVGIDEEFRNNPDAAPAIIEQEVATKAWHLALIEADPIDIGSANYPATSPDAPYWEEINVRIGELWQEQNSLGIEPVNLLVRRIDEQIKAMEQVFDPVLWRDFLDRDYYPKVQKAMQRLEDERSGVLQPTSPEYYELMMGATGVLPMVAEYAAQQSRVFYEAAGQELPAADRAHIRVPGRKPRDCLNLIKHDMNSLLSAASGISPAAMVRRFKLRDN